MNSARLTQLAFAFLLAACGGGDQGLLDPDVVTDLPEGDASGDALTGEYEFESLTRDCEGQCAVEVGGFIYSACDIGYRETGDFAVTQRGGRLIIDSDDSDYVSRVEGGINKDGSFDIGGVRTHLGGEVRSIVRIQGTAADGAVQADAWAKVQGSGSYGDESWSVDCWAYAEVTGARE